MSKVTTGILSAASLRIRAAPAASLGLMAMPSMPESSSSLMCCVLRLDRRLGPDDGELDVRLLGVFLAPRMSGSQKGLRSR